MEEGITMSSRMGITTDPDARRADWESQVVGFRNWRLLRTFGAKLGAKKYAAQYAQKYGCRVSPDDVNGGGMWYVYRFNYDTMRTETLPPDINSLHSKSKQVQEESS